jgi:hypothetical protein
MRLQAGKEVVVQHSHEAVFRPFKNHAPKVPDQHDGMSLSRRTTSFTDAWNERCDPFEWTKEADELIDKAKRKKTSLTRH